VGTALTAVIGVIFFSEDVNGVKVVSLAAIIAGVIGLNLSRA
jgi:multidrug transporter EmrE-like cation transporter